ncbi:MAG TPA: purine-nucleoside phosphorylase [Gemmatimonadetes bacterium]|nr:purine-nucleoside phosphorylase [Gemmatimonadota bacterium]
MATKQAARPVEDLAFSFSAHGLEGFELAFVLGSGLGAFAERLEDAHTVSFHELHGMPESRVPGHAGRFVLGTTHGVRVLVQQGRVHLYEGWSAEEVTRSTRAMAKVGARGMILTNAAGGLDACWRPPCLMRITDHLNLQGCTPLARSEMGRGTPYGADFGAALERGASEAKIAMYKGVYAGLPGPSYETASEVRLLRRMGADAVGMSTVTEALAAHASGMQVGAISCISNYCAGIADQPLDHDEVVEAGAHIADDFCRVLECATPHLAAALGD